MKSGLILIGLFFVNAALFAQEIDDKAVTEREMKRKYEADRQKGENAVSDALDNLDKKDKEKRAGIQPFPTMSLTMQMEFPEKPKNNMSIDYYYRNYECVSVMKMQNDKGGIDRTIMNFKEGSSTMLMTDKKGKKTGMVMEMKNFDWAIQKGIDKNNKLMAEGDATLIPTEEYKTIEGYKCRKYLYEDLNTKSEMWVGSHPDIDHKKFNLAFQSVYATSKAANQNAWQKAGMNGMVIQMHSIPKGGRGEESIMTMKNIKTGSVPDEMFSTTGYEITRMPSLRDTWNEVEKRQ